MMGIKLLILLMQTAWSLWIPELSVRSELLGELSYGVITDTLTDFFVNPAYSAKIKDNKIYCSQQGYTKPCLRGVALTKSGLSGYAKINVPFSTNEVAYSPMNGKVGMAYAVETSNNSFGIGYLYGFEERNYYYGTVVDSEETHSFGAGMIHASDSSNRINGVLNVSLSQARVHYGSEITKMVAALGIGNTGKNNNYFSVIYISWLDTTLHYNVTVFARKSFLLVNTNTSKIHIIGQLEDLYSHKPMYYHNVGLDNRVTFRLVVSGEKTFDKLSIFGNFSQHIGHSSYTNFVFLSENPFCLGSAIRINPLELWIRMSPYIYEYRYWNIELLYRLP